MFVRSQSAAHARRPLSQWLRSAPAVDGDASGASGAGDQRARLLAQIREFLVGNDLEVNPANLVTAYNIASGSKPRLAMQAAERQSGGQTITQQWLDDHPEHQSDAREMELSRQMIAELDTVLSGFSRQTTAARSAASDYSSDLERHMFELEENTDGGELVSRLVSLTRRMAEQTRQIEAELGTREKEARKLRRQVGEMKRDAEQDHLTGLPNRRAFEAQFASDRQKAENDSEALSIAFCDVDHFKRVNDTHGHEAGDRVLKMVAKVLSRITNDRCHVARHGGEEFVMLFRGKDTLQAKQALDTARETLGALRLVNRDTDEPIGQLTFSAGVADVFANEDPRDALRAADEALYRAKKTGRNQVIIA